jgi:hypothetical protein
MADASPKPKRRIEAAQRTARPEAPSEQHGGLGFLIPIVAGGALAAYNPKLGMGAGGLTPAIGAIYKKDWRWWIVGGVILAAALFFYWENQKEPELSRANQNRKQIENMGQAQMERRRRISRSHQLAFDNTLRLTATVRTV